ncbi:MAG: L-threonylcarbamoyladenylate synthase [Prevotella sp.]|jgi:tRNA threonylcarbamoyl adenosine modification protein (Sua5/YciO/YrdC/YwlC family)
MTYIKLYSKNNSQRDLDRITDLLKDGGIIVYPTDTAYALGCSCLKERAVERICKIKDINPAKHYLSIVGPDLSHISEFAKVDNATFKLLKRNTPGPFTFILNPSSHLPKIFRNRKQVGIRIPDNPIARLLCEQLDAPLLSTTVPYDEDDDIEYLTNPELIAERLGDEVDMVIDGGIGSAERSTIVDCTSGEPEIVRQGKGEII